jgi:DNA-3-methyladenine glycosylase
MLGDVLGEEFYKRSAEKVAPELLGKFLVREISGVKKALAITEVEIYDGEEDEACHAYKGRTERTEVMYYEGGHWYVYLCYGIHFLLNIVVGEEGHPSAILIRGVEGYPGPGKLTARLGIDKDLNKEKARKESGLWVENRGVVVPKNKIIKTPRIGINYAKEPWLSKKWRFVYGL